MNPKHLGYNRHFLSEEMSAFLVELSVLMDKHKVSLEFEAESVKGQGAMLTIKRTEDDLIRIEVESPQTFDFDSEMLHKTLKQSLVY